MRQLFVLCTICLLAGLAAGQATVISGYASNQGRPGYYPATPFVPLVTTPSVSLDNTSGLLTVISGYASNQGRPGYYPATPFVPLVTTPSVSLDNASGLLAGASNATPGNVTGAATATLSIVGTSANAPSSLPVWYGTSSTVAPEVRSSEVGTATPSSRYFETGIATFEMGSGAAEAAKLSQANRKRAARVYTNEDIDHINQQNGTVKYKGKTEQIS